MPSTKSLPALDTEDAVRRSRQIKALLTSLTREKASLDAQIIEAVGVGNAVTVDGEVTRAKQGTPGLGVSIEALTAAHEAGDVSRGVFYNYTQRTVNSGLVKLMLEAGKLPASVRALLVRGTQPAAYVDHI